MKVIDFLYHPAFYLVTFLKELSWKSLSVTSRWLLV